MTQIILLIQHSQIPEVTVRAFEVGSKEEVPHYKFRVEEEEIKQLLKPHKYDKISAFYIITGEHGTGKSTLVQQACFKVGGGAIYLNIEKGSSFVNDLANAVAFRFNDDDWWSYLLKKVDLTNASQEKNPLDSVLKHIKKCAKLYYQRHNRPPVLVIDSVNKLTNDFLADLETLLGFAKYCADSGILRIVFVASEGYAGTFMVASQGITEKDRIADVIEIGDIPIQQAIKYLKGRGISEEVAEQAVKTITGGRFSLLATAAEVLTENSIEQLEEWRIKVFSSVEEDFYGADLLSDYLTPFYVKAWQVIEHIYDHGSLSSLAFKRNFTKAAGRSFLQKNILARRANGTVTFQSLAVKLYVRTIIGEPGSEQRNQFDKYLSIKAH